MEFECHPMANRTMRSVAVLVKRYVSAIIDDVNLVIEKPYVQKEDEPTFFLGMCRFHKIAVTTCPKLPPRTENGEDKGKAT